MAPHLACEPRHCIWVACASLQGREGARRGAGSAAGERPCCRSVHRDLQVMLQRGAAPLLVQAELACIMRRAHKNPRCLVRPDAHSIDLLQQVLHSSCRAALRGS